MFYTQLSVTCQPDLNEILIAEISQAGFESFLETDNGFEAYVEEEKYDPLLLQEIQTRYVGAGSIQYAFQKILKENWNEQWERSITPINIENRCYIRAHFHEAVVDFPFEIIITPKMSFGTGHHATTYLMVKMQLELEIENKRVMDAGCGTCVLSILASKQGAAQVEAFDIDEWSVTNSLENIENNNVNQVRVSKGTIAEMKFHQPFDVILANINKNILMVEMSAYAHHLQNDGLLLLCGFYISDIPDLINEAAKFGFVESKRDEKEGWAALLFMKKT